MGRSPRPEVARSPRHWSLKHLHRQIVLSAVYRQQSSPAKSAMASADPENRLLGRMNRRRLDFESLRDSFVAVSGSLNATIGGPSVDLLAGFVPRRTLYGTVDRQDLATLYRDYDFPDPSAMSPQRESTTVPPQALFLMNNVFASESAARVLSRSDVRTVEPVDAKLERLTRLLFARNPSDQERQLARDYLGTTPDAAKWQRYVHALLLTNEFAFVD